MPIIKRQMPIIDRTSPTSTEKWCVLNHPGFFLNDGFVPRVANQLLSFLQDPSKPLRGARQAIEVCAVQQKVSTYRLEW